MLTLTKASKLQRLPKHLAIRYSSIQNSGNQSEPSDNHSLKKDVLDLYKYMLILSRDWPTDLRPRIRSAFAQNRHVDSPEEIRKLIARGEYVCREITATYHLSKYRAMKRRYYDEDGRKQLDEMFKNLDNKQQSI